MTEKRFNFVGGYLYDGNKPIGHVEDIKFRQDFEDIVNALHDENEQLKQQIQEKDRLLKTKDKILASDKQLKIIANLEKTIKEMEK